uniref:Uncharacterized protein n=1 Tax=Romanomermis culicivorax TaxID=13658 RepID=A0A915ISA6_ROMCU
MSHFIPIKHDKKLDETDHILRQKIDFFTYLYCSTIDAIILKRFDHAFLTSLSKGPLFLRSMISRKHAAAQIKSEAMFPLCTTFMPILTLQTGKHLPHRKVISKPFFSKADQNQIRDSVLKCYIILYKNDANWLLGSTFYGQSEFQRAKTRKFVNECGTEKIEIKVQRSKKYKLRQQTSLEAGFSKTWDIKHDSSQGAKASGTDAELTFGSKDIAVKDQSPNGKSSERAAEKLIS